MSDTGCIYSSISESRHWQHQVSSLELEEVYGLVLHREHGDEVPVEVESLIVRQEDLVRLEDDGVGDDALGDLDGVEGVVLERVPGVGRDGLVVPVELVHRRVVLLVDERGRTHDDVLAVLGEEAALPSKRKFRAVKPS